MGVFCPYSIEVLQFLMINHTAPATPKTDELTSLLRSRMPDLGEIHLRGDTLTADLDPSSTAELAGEPIDELTRYLDRAGRWTRLSAEEELHLGRLAQSGRDSAGNYDRAGQAALDHLVCSNLRLVHHAIMQFSVHRDLVLSLLSAGNVALLESARNYDASKGLRFSTYAYWGIRAAIMSELNFQFRTVRLPRNIHEQFAKIRKETRRLTLELGRVPADNELAEAVGCAPEKLTELQSLQQCGRSLDAPLADEGETTLGDTLTDEGAMTPAEAAAQSDDLVLLHKLFGFLTERESEIIRLRNGLGCEAQTLEAIGQRQNVSRERIRQLEESAMRKLRVAARS
jgi:RNA polymerase primary sigma factor